MKLATFDTAGLPTAFYDPTFQQAPDGAVALSDDQWAEFIAHQGERCWNGTTVVAYEAPLATLRSAKLAELRAACAAAIVAGYSSSALGSPHLYPATLTDQSNMLASVTSSLLPGLAEGWTTPFWCADAAGVWARRQHTVAQIRQAGSDGVAHVLAQQDLLSGLENDLAAAGSAAAVGAVVWPTGGA